MDIVYIRDLKVSTVIGVFNWERRIRQVVNIDLELGTDIRQAAATDELQYTLNYKDVADKVTALVEQNEAGLLETLAERLAHFLLEEYALPWVRISLAKTGVMRGTATAGVTIERSRH